MRGWWAAIAALWVAGCGDDVQPGCDPDAMCGVGTGTDGSGNTASTMSGVASTSVADTGSATIGDTEGPGSDSTGAGDTSTDGPAGTTDTGEVGSTDSGDGSTTGEESSTGAQGNVVYTAHALIGALDRIRVFKEDLDDDRCTWLVLVAPEIGGQYDVTTPEGWSVESIQASDVGDACGSRSPAMFGAEVATTAEGSVELGAVGPSGVYPCEVTVDVTATFAGVLPGVPPIDVLDASAIPVDGC